MKNEIQAPSPLAGDASHNEAVKANLEALRSRDDRPPSVTIGKSPDEIYAFLRNFSNYPKFVKGIAEVKAVTAKVSHWVAEATEGKVPHEWDSELIVEKPGELLAWRNLENSAFKQSGSISLEPARGARVGTVVRMKITYDKPFAKFLGQVGKLIGQDPDAESAMNLRRLKAFLETGEVPTIEGQPSGRDPDAETIKH